MAAAANVEVVVCPEVGETLVVKINSSFVPEKVTKVQSNVYPQAPTVGGERSETGEESGRARQTQ